MYYQMKQLLLLFCFITYVTASEYKTVYDLVFQNFNNSSPETMTHILGNKKFYTATESTPWPEGECWPENKLKGEEYIASLNHDTSFFIMSRTNVKMENLHTKGFRIEGNKNGRTYRSLTTGFMHDPFNQIYCMVEVLEKDCDFCRRLMMAKCLLQYLYNYL